MERQYSAGLVVYVDVYVDVVGCMDMGTRL